MALNTNGALLEGVRVSTGNNAFTYPPRTVVTDSSVLQAVKSRGEYMLFADFVSTPVADVNPFSPAGADIGDPNLVVRWTKNGASVVRFDYDHFGRRWSTMPGGSPDLLGTVGNSPRLVASVSDLTDTSAPYDLYIGSPARLVTFAPVMVPNPASFGNPVAGTVEISESDGTVNFGSSDLANPAYAGQKVYQIRQSFFDRTKVTGVLGQVPQSAAESYYLFMNPRPASGQTPRLRIGFRPCLEAVEVPTESALGSPAAGTFAWSADTGRVALSSADVAAYSGESVYYDGVLLGSVALARTRIGNVAAFPVVGGTLPAELLTDLASFVLFAEPASSPRYFFQNVSVDSSSGLPTDAPAGGTVYVDVATGNLYFSPVDAVGASDVYYVRTRCYVENGVAVQLYQSGVNTSGEAQVQDLTVKYVVADQLVQDGIGQSPFVTLPTVPLVDASLLYYVAPGPGSSGTFSGPLVDGTDPTKTGVGYYLDLTKKQLSFTQRQPSTLVLQKDQSMVKLPDAAIVPSGIQVSKNGTALTAGVDFDFNSSSGLMEFITPVGENDPANVLDVAGTFSGSTFTASHPVLGSAYSNAYLLVGSGPNAGVWPILAVSSSRVVTVSGAFPASGSGSADLRSGAEVVADRFWTPFKPPYKKISVKRGQTDSMLVALGVNDFSVFATTGQVNVVKPAAPDELFLVEYTSLDSPDYGVTVTPNARTEYASFKVRQEAATTHPGTPNVSINPSGKTVDTTKAMKVYVDGVTQDPSSYTFTAPGSLLVAQVITTETVTVDYHVREATGGETNFVLSYSPVDVDFPDIPAGTGPAVFNGDQRQYVQKGTPFLVGGKDVHIAATVSYDSVSDTTSVTFESAPAADSAGAPLMISSPVSGPGFRVAETAATDPLPKGTNALTIAGNRPYQQGTIVTVDGDAYLVQAVSYDATADKTSLVTAAPALRNYIIPSVTRTVRPVLNSGATFSTSKPANLDYPFTLAKDGGKGVLVRDVDYSVGEGGTITLAKPAVFGDAVYAMYVGRVPQPAGTSFDLNYARFVAPGASNGLQGQRLYSSYNLFAPDTFFFRIETVTSFIPEVIDELQKSAQSNGSSGPNIQSRASLKTKDFGSPSLYFDEQHLGNLDVVVSRLLQFYNDLINSYEDVLSDLDGRVVGGVSGKFRYDGNLNNPLRTDYSQVTNDIDDRVKLYDAIGLVSVRPFTFINVPVSEPMWLPNALSRIFPTAKVVTAALNDQVGILNFGKTLGSLNQGSLTSVSMMTSARARARILSVDVTRSVFTVDNNGDPDNLLPPFVIGASVTVYARDGAPDVTGLVTNVYDVTPTGPWVVALAVTTTLTDDRLGSLMQDTSDSSIALNHFYTPGRDIGVNSDNGQVFNITVNLPLLPNIQNPVIGSELVDAPLTYANSDVSPKRFPALDGSVLTDSGRVSEPPLYRLCETDLLSLEDASYAYVGNGAVQIGGVTVSGASLVPDVGATIVWLNGPNAGVQSTVIAPVTTSSFTLSIPVTVDLPGSDFYVNSHVPNPVGLLADEVGVVSTNVAAAPAAPALIGTLDSQITSSVSIAASFGQAVASGVGSASGNVLTDPNANFATVTQSSLLLVPSGANTGLYKLASFTSTTITVDPTAPFSGFVASGSTTYRVIQPWSFLSSKEFQVVSVLLAQDAAYLVGLLAWQAAVTLAGVTARKSAIVSRQAQVANYIQLIQGLLGKDDHLYDMRFLWIQQRVDRKQGTLARQAQATSKRQEATAKLLADQQKLLVVSKLPQ